MLRSVELETRNGDNVASSETGEGRGSEGKGTGSSGETVSVWTTLNGLPSFFQSRAASVLDVKNMYLGYGLRKMVSTNLNAVVSKCNTCTTGGNVVSSGQRRRLSVDYVHDFWDTNNRRGDDYLMCLHFCLHHAEHDMFSAITFENRHGP